MGLIIALVALVAVGAMLLGREADVTYAGGPPKATVSLDIQTTGPNSCSVVNEAKCTLNATDAFDVVLTIKGDNSAVIPYGNWGATLNHTGLTSSAADSTCAATAIETPGAGSTTLGCSGLTAAVNSSKTLATVTLACVAGSHTISVKGLTGTEISTANAGSDVVVNCGETASMDLSRKDTEKPYIKDQVQISVEIDDLKLKDADGDGTAGYEAWQALIKWDPDKLDLASVVFKTDLSIQTQDRGFDDSPKGDSILLGASRAVTQNPSTQTGNVVNLTFNVLEGAAVASADVQLDTDPLLTYIISEKATVLDSGSELTISNPTETVSASAALVSLSVKSGCKVPVASNTCRVEDGGSVVIGVSYSNVGVAVATAEARVRFDTGTAGPLTHTSTAFPADPPCDPLNQNSTPAATNVTINCSDDTPVQQDTANVFEVTLACATSTSSASDTVSLINAGSRTSVSSPDNAKLPVNVSKALTIVCVGSASDEDLDACTAAEEAALGLDPNRFDYPDLVTGVHNDEDILIGDVLGYVLSFGTVTTGPGDGSPAADVVDSSLIIDDGDINHAVDLFGTVDCGA